MKFCHSGRNDLSSRFMPRLWLHKETHIAADTVFELDFGSSPGGHPGQKRISGRFKRFLEISGQFS